MIQGWESRRGLTGKGILLCCALLVIAGCTSSKLNLARQEFYMGRIDKAMDTLSSITRVPERDRLLFDMEKGLILHHQGKYQESIDTLRQASAVMAEQEKIRIGEQSGSLVTSEKITEYKGEYAERLWVHTYLIMDYLMLGDHENALVEAKQALKIYSTYPEACANDYFTRALIAHCYEASGEINDAYIEYKKLAQTMPDPSPVADKLYALGKRLGFYDEIEAYQGYLSPEDIKTLERDDYSEAILFIGQGQSPIKVPKNIVIPPSIRFSFPTYEDRGRGFFSPVIQASGAGPARLVTTSTAEVLKTSLEKRMTKVIAKETARAASKEVISQSIDDPVVEILARAAFFVTEEPDTRCWQTLPAYLTLARLPTAPEAHSLHVTGLNITGEVLMRQPGFEPGRAGRYFYYSLRDVYGIAEVEP